MPPAEVMPTPSSQIFFPGVYVFTTCGTDKSSQDYSGEPVIQSQGIHLLSHALRGLVQAFGDGAAGQSVPAWPWPVTLCLCLGWVVGDHSFSFLPLPHVHSHLLELLPNVLSCSQSQTLLFPCSVPMHSVPQAALSCPLSSPWPLSRWLPAMGSPRAPVALQCGSTGSHIGATWIRGGQALKEKAVVFLQSQTVSPTAEEGLLCHRRGPWHRWDMQVHPLQGFSWQCRHL